MSDDGKFVLRWDLHEETRTSTLNSLWQNEDFLDVTIACDDDQIDAHKVILSAASPFFESILKRNPHNHPLLYLRGTTKKNVQSLLNFIYSGETQVSEEELHDFMALASSLHIQGLTGELSGVKQGKYDELNEIKSTLGIRDRKKEGDSKGKEQFVDPSKIIAESLSQKVKTTSDKAGKESSSGKKSILKKHEICIQEEVQVVELSDDVGEHENYVSYEDDSYDYSSTSNTSSTEYDEKVLGFVAKSGNFWTCTGCVYSAKKKSHLIEHAENHVDGYAHACNNCGKAFSKKRNLRSHKYKCTTMDLN